MKLNLKHLEQGLQRLYYVAWAGSYWAFGWAAIRNLERYSYPTTPENLALGGVILLTALLAPWVVMRIIRWVYRGFIPKPTE